VQAGAVRVDVPGDQPPGVDADELPAQPWFIARVAVGLLGVAAQFEEPHARGALPHGVIDQERDLRVLADVAVFRGAFHGVSADVDGGELSVVLIADRLDLEAAGRAESGQPALAVLAEIAGVDLIGRHSYL
jgi:hypothetical protein